MFSVKMGEELIRVFQLGDEDDRVHIIILTADPAAPAFCAGVSIVPASSSILKAPQADIDKVINEHRDPGGQVAMAIYNNRKITIAAVNGHASGTGATALQLPFDFRVIWASAKVTFPFVRLGIVPDSTSTYLLTRLIGQSNAAYMLLSGDPQKPNAHYLASLYHQILPTQTEILPVAIEVAKNVAYGIGQVSYAYTKGLIHRSGASIEENHLLESRAIKIIGMSKDTVEGAQSFIERRRPKYTDTLSENASSWYPWWKPLDVKNPKSKL
ncbi:hypothetical protein GYMLUDRAFT_231271 [Collybiopsis luxurians FD-317 M1]|uniref:Uncharacterized protein n=1 Tax=Collybiopsis luxurians FD-317 M1 TaxID=944289 RepID=A0A0D0BK93_9AGAR|nr:hypothetical protein GYMLUDRAFT_231271 [Collybiopsis luxurians FD-317 M1]